MVCLNAKMCNRLVNLLKLSFNRYWSYTMSAHTDTNQNFDQAELEQLVSIVLENMRTKNDRFFPHRFQLFKSLGLKRLLELFKTNDLPSWVVDACVSDRDEENHWSWYDLCNIPDELLLNYIDTFGKDSPNKYLAGIQRQRTLLAYSLIVLLAKSAFHTKVLIYGCRIKKSWMTDGTAKSFPSFTTSAFSKIDKTKGTIEKSRTM